MIGEKSTTKRFMHSRCGLVRKPITEPLYTSKIQHDPQFTIGIRGNKMCFMLKSTFIQLPLSQETHLVLSSILQHGHYDEVNQWMLPQILSTTLYLEHSQWTFVSVDHAFRFLPHWSAVYKCKIATTVFSLSLIVIRWLQ